MESAIRLLLNFQKEGPGLISHGIHLRNDSGVICFDASNIVNCWRHRPAASR